MSETRFTWLPFFEEMLSVICERYDKHSLCQLAHEIFGDSGKLIDRMPDGSTPPFKEIDPLTFIGYFNRKLALANKSGFCNAAKHKMGIQSETPNDFTAIPSTNYQNAWFFTTSDSPKRGEHDIDIEWDFAQQLNRNEITDDIFKKVLSVHKVGIAKLTIVMFACKPNTYISLDKTNLNYIKNKGFHAIEKMVKTIEYSSQPFTNYMSLVKDISNYFSSKSFYEISSMAYSSKKIEHNENTRYWLIAPGQNALAWETWTKKGVIAIGWNFLGDLTDYSSKEEIGISIQKHDLKDTNPKHNQLACWQFCNEMKEGDYVFAKKGASIILGYGEVVSDYIFENNDSGEALPDTAETYQNIRKVRWITTGEWDIPENKAGRKTLTDITENHELISYLQNLINTIPEPRKIPDSTVKLYSRDEALNKLFISESEFDSVVTALRIKKNIILQGPPGVGKTFLARHLAYTLLGEEDNNRIQMIQFHQSYSYEDFIQGYRPGDDGTFVLKDGIFYRFCQTAQNDTRPHIFIIDEINRGNLSRIFGELMMLIETDKRGPRYSVPLTYARTDDDTFYVPENLYLIGTMNTADRSLAMVDYALRRRFRFVELWPQFHNPKFIDFLMDKGVDSDLAQAISHKLQSLNKIISDQKNDLGPGYQIGHSFFCADGQGTLCDPKWYNDIITHEIEPLLKEYWFDETDTDKVSEMVQELRNLHNL